MTTRVLPDIEEAVIAYLLGVTAVTDVVGERVFTHVPELPAVPYLQITLISGRDESYHWLGKALIQVAGWSAAGLNFGRENARDACATAVAALHDATNTLVGDCLIVGCEDVITARPLPDPSTSQPRFLADVLVTYHPALTGS